MIGAAEPVRRPDASASLFNMPAEKFFALEKAARPIVLPKIDHVLMAAALFHETNLRRETSGKHRLRRDPRLESAARMHAGSMAAKNYVDHVDPDRRTPEDRALAAGFKPRYLAENIATHFGIRYEGGRTIYRVQTPQGSAFSYQPDGPPIPRHTYRSFTAAVLDQWMNSPGHRKNILADRPEFFGAGCAPQQTQTGMDTVYCVQLFGSPME